MSKLKETARVARLAVMVVADLLKPCRPEYRLPSRWVKRAA